MSFKDDWIIEYTKLLESKDVHKRLDELLTILDSMLEDSNIKYILTSRIKAISSLNEKIKRNGIDQEPSNHGKKITDILDDMIGIRIICMKSSDENKILEKLLNNKEKLCGEKINILSSLKQQPDNQKNGHKIFKIKGLSMGYGLEIQIKSLSNLFWGEMEHLLIYKNNKYLMNNAYYKKEMNSIYKELEIIDTKLTYMEEVMMSDDEKSLLTEKKEILKRLLYLNVKDKLKNEFEGEYLNNNYIFDGIANLIFQKIMIKKSNRDINKEEEYNKRLSDAISLILDPSKMAFDFSKFIDSDFTNMQDPEDKVSIKFFEALADKKNGWWYFIILYSLFRYNRVNIEFDGHSLSSEDIKEQIVESIEEVSKLLKIKLYGNIDKYWNIDSGESKFIKELVTQIKCEQIEYYTKKKVLCFTDEKYVQNFNTHITSIIGFLSIGRQEEEIEKEHIDGIKVISKNIVHILSSLSSNEINIKKDIESINTELVKLGILSLTFPNQLMEREKISLSDLIDSINKSKVGEE